MADTVTTETTQARGSRKELLGTVVSNKMQKTIVVEVARRVQHPEYKKFVRSHTRYKAHDENNEANIGDVVVIQESRPLSKEKRWRLHEIKRRAVT